MKHNKIRRLASAMTTMITLAVVIVVIAATNWIVRRFHTPGHLDLIAAQAMDMSAMRPPMGAAPVAPGTIRRG